MNTIVNNMGDKVMGKVVGILRSSSGEGLTITDLVKKSKFSRSVVRITLAKLEGAQKVHIRKVGMAKIYSLKSSSSINRKKLKRSRKNV